MATTPSDEAPVFSIDALELAPDGLNVNYVLVISSGVYSVPVNASRAEVRLGRGVQPFAFTPDGQRTLLGRERERTRAPVHA
ncbi:MAG: hypothetical protein HOP15_00385 [Planctomycetes bacterium]|nr:hypothetical protein [Planctomycetota bacterium]